MVVKMHSSKARKYDPEHIVKPPVYYPVAILTPNKIDQNRAQIESNANYHCNDFSCCVFVTDGHLEANTLEQCNSVGSMEPRVT